MTIILSPDQIQIRDLVRKIATERVASRASEIDATAQYPHDMYALLKELGLFSLPFPEEYGGTGSMVTACLAIEELGRVCYNTAYLLLVQWVPFVAILASGSDEQKRRYLPGLAAGDLRGALALTEPQSGSDVAGIKTKAENKGDHYLINGSKSWCTNAGLADFILVAAKTGDVNSRGDIGLFLMETDRAGFELGRKEDKMGARGVPSWQLHFDAVKLPLESRIGGAETGFKVVMEALNHSRPIIGARGVGLAQGALDHTLSFIQDRTAFGKTVSDFQGVRWMIADMAIQIEASRHLVYAAAEAVDRGVKGNELAQVAAIAKCHATDTAMRVATDAVQLFGASGISNDFPINRYFRDAKVLQIIEGTNQIQRNIISRNVLAGGLNR